MNFDAILSRVQDFSDITRRHHCTVSHTETRRPWAVKYDFINGITVEIRAAEWTVYHPNGSILGEGQKPDGLDSCLKVYGAHQQ